MAKVIIYSGIPGSGKSTLIAIRHAADAIPPSIYSTDNYFMKNGHYGYVREKQDEAHLWNLRRFLQYITGGSFWGDTTTIVDNVNATTEHIAPYAQAARAFGHEVQIVTMLVDPIFAHSRNVHGVSLESVQRMADQLAHRVLPKTWPEERIYVPSERINQR